MPNPYGENPNPDEPLQTGILRIMAKRRYQSKPKVTKTVAVSRKPEPLRLSQCMIVKNEESNIERALMWGKDIVYEQIVVDTGSTDKTVEIAESMGAKVFHFEWIDDFAAAKNFAISKATGNWIAFLDADEYFTGEDAGKIPAIIDYISKQQPNISEIYCPLADLNDAGKIFSTKQQDRIFKNNGDMYYKGRIHEYLTSVKHGADHAYAAIDDIVILHTGYQQSVYKSNEKLDRNIKMLRKELSDSPDNTLNMVYLAESLNATRKAENMEEAKRLFVQVVDSGKKLSPFEKVESYTYLLLAIFRDSGPKDDLFQKYSQKALEELPDSMFVIYFQALALAAVEDYAKAWSYFTRAESLLDTRSINEFQIMLGQIANLFANMSECAEKMGDTKTAIKYAVMSLRENKTQPNLLAPLIFQLKDSETSDDEVLEFLVKLYDLSNPKDILFIARAAKTAGALELTKQLMSVAEEMLK
jgi:glycosyltransferase involved in cell wall biosynthesis